MPNLAPYKIVTRNGKIAVVNNANEVKAIFDSKPTDAENRAAADRYLSALYSQVPGAATKKGKAESAGAGVVKDGPYGKVEYADPGYQKDGKPRYPLDSEQHVRSAWGYINHSDDANKYSPSQLAIVRHRILLAAKHFGVDIQADEKAQMDRLRARYLTLDEARRAAEDADGPKVSKADDTTADVNHTGVMVAFFLPPAMATELAVAGGEPVDELHLTLCYLGDLADVAPDIDTLERLRAVVAGFSHTCAPVDGQISGVGLFTAGDTDVTYATPDVPELPKLRHRLVEALKEAGFAPYTNHGYTPHITLAYDNLIDTADVPNLDFTLDTITLAAGNNRFGFLMDAPSDNDGDEVVGDDPASEEAAFKQGPPVEKITEQQLISQNRTTPQALAPHAYAPAKYATTTGGSQACLTCGGPQPERGPLCNAPEETTQASDVNSTARFLISEVVPRLDSGPVVIPTKAFVTEVGPRTILTGPASIIEQAFEKSMTPNRHFMWMAGRFVGADEPNRNGAFWAADDLEMGQATVKHGPLNWLHEGRHVIGSIADAQFVRPAFTEDADDNNGAASNVDGAMRPHIAALSVVWRYLFPDEAAVMEMASDSGKLWYSMECVSDSVKCLGCGAEAAYMDYLNGVNGSCQHMIQRSAARHFVNPTFLGGAVIVPPVRPGWAQADARVMTQAAQLAERAYEQAGRPDITASEWEQMMAQVVTLGLAA